MFKKFWHRRAAKKSLLLSQKEKRLDSDFKIRHVRVLLDASLAIEQQFFNDLAKSFGIAPVNVSVFAFSATNEIGEQYSHFFNPEDVGFFGQFEGNLALLCAKEVDLQINYFDKEDLYMSWVGSSAKKKFSVGFAAADQRLNDLIFDFPPTEIDTFKVELVKYLTVLKKL